ncbi:hypothetical protein Cni_G00008 [Canna indica]|uniref:Uncharacterized protein n=1 Tax=Canna indica TaxID=4628 RepID=A0AAQ3JKN3_9LILI|nr:hypothetical protein Cni_G00008 [Canna indica]
MEPIGGSLSRIAIPTGDDDSLLTHPSQASMVDSRDLINTWTLGLEAQHVDAVSLIEANDQPLGVRRSSRLMKSGSGAGGWENTDSTTRPVTATQSKTDLGACGDDALKDKLLSLGLRSSMKEAYHVLRDFIEWPVKAA